MWIVLDVITAALLIFSVVTGYRKGLIKTAFGLGIIVASLIISSSFSPTLSSYVRTTKQYISFTESINNNIADTFQKSVGQDSEKTDAGSTQDVITENTEEEKTTLDKVLSSVGVDLDFRKLENDYNEALSSGAKNAAEALDETVVQPIAKLLCDALCFVAVFVVSVIALHLLMLVLELLFRLPLLKGVNKVSGALCGVLLGLIKVFVFCTVFQIVLPYIKNQDIGLTLDLAEKTYIYSFFYGINPLKFLY